MRINFLGTANFSQPQNIHNSKVSSTLMEAPQSDSVNFGTARYYKGKLTSVDKPLNRISRFFQRQNLILQAQLEEGLVKVNPKKTKRSN